MRRLILWVVLLTIGTLVADLAGGAWPDPARARTVHSTAPPVTQTVTVSEQTPPAITSASTASFTVGRFRTFTVTATGRPTPGISETGTLPAGVTFVDNENGTATLSGTPRPGTAAAYRLTISADNGVKPDAIQSFTLTVTATATASRAPAITSANAASFTVGKAGNFMVDTTGSPTPKISKTGTLPAGVTFEDSTDGVAWLSGTPGPGTGGTYRLTIRAANGVLPDAIQSFTLTVTAAATVSRAPVITSANAAAFTAGKAGNFMVTATGRPTPKISETGTLPAGVTFEDSTDGVTSLSGTPGPGTGGTYRLTIRAANGVLPDAIQSFTLTVTATATVSRAPAITSANAASFTAGTAGAFTVTATGSPTPKIGSTGTLPSGVTLVDHRDGTATLSGTPGPGTAAAYRLTITAANGVLPDATQSFTLTVTAATVSRAPAITSASTASFTAGTAGAFTVTATGSPTPKIGSTGTLPSGVTLVDHRDGVASLSGTPGPGTAAAYRVTITAANGVLPDAIQSFTLTVAVPGSPLAPAITSASTASFTAGTAGAFTVTATGSPTPKIGNAGTLPSGVTLVDHRDGTATLSGTPGPGTAAAYRLTITAANGVLPDATQSFTLTVAVPGSPLAPAITSASTASFTAGTAGAFTVTATGSPTPKIGNAGTLPSGVTLVDHRDGTATLSGTPGRGTAAAYRLTITAANGVLPDATQSFTLTTVPATSQSSSRAVPWWLAALAVIGVLIAVTAGAVVIHRVRRHRANLRKRIRAVPRPEAGTVNLDRSEPALAHTVRLEPHADRGTSYLEDEP